MCGIAGFIHPDEKAPEILSRMMASIAHRGPDDRGQIIDSKVCLGHQRLSIIDLETGQQPMGNDDQSVWVLLNGEIYNYIELKEDLIARGHRFRTTSDTEVILHLYDEYAERCVDYLNGMFAFVIYDRRRNQLFAARDRFGIKPFYYTLRGGQFIFASEIKALLQHPEVTATLNRRALTEYILLQLCMGRKTLFDGIQKLEPAHGLMFDLIEDRCRVWEYWHPQSEIDSSLSESAVLEELESLLRDSVRIQLRSNVPVGVYLSGGLDSSLVACLAADLSSQTIKTFTGGFHEHGPYDESSYAKQVVASRKNLEYYEIFPTSTDFSDSLSKLIYHMDEPAGGPGLFSQYMAATLAAQHVKVVLGGQGGDEIFGGYARYFLLHAEQLLLDAVSNPSRFDLSDLSILWKKRGLLAAYFPSIKKLLRHAHFSEPWAMRYFRLLNRAEKAQTFYHPDVINPEHLADIEEEFESIFNRPKNGSLFERATYFDFRTLLPALLQVEDRVSMAVSLESRVPLLDHRIIDLLSRLTSEMKFNHGELKHILKKVAQRIVPKSIVERRDKIGFPVPLVYWAKGELKPFMRDILMSRNARNRGIMFNDTIVQALGHEQPFGRDLWGVLCLELWFNNFIDK